MNLQRNMDPPVRITPTEEPGAIDRVMDPDPIGLTELTKLLLEERIFGPCLRQRLPQRALDCPVGFVTGVPSAFSVAETPDSK